MEKVIRYKANDGKMFDNENDCLNYEQQCEDLSAANDMLSNGASLMACLTRANNANPFWDESISNEDRVLLMKITKETGFSIPHWQCRYEKGYYPFIINRNNEIYLFGEVKSSIGYGSWVTLPDIIRYKKNEKEPV